MDQVLLVRGLRTYGQIIKFQDAHLIESFEESPLYQQALRDRLLIETAEELVPGWVEGCQSIGVTAGASTAEDTVDEVVARLNSLGST